MSVFNANTFIPPACSAPFIRRSDFYATNVRFSREGVPPQTLRARGVKKMGLAYERRVLDVFVAIYGSRFVVSPMIYYTSLEGQQHRAIPDGLLYPHGNLSEVWIIEVKLAHTEMVWDQLIERYLPLIQILHPGARVRTIEVCRSYDPAVPVPHNLIASLHEQSAGGLEVMKWKI
jgi:hypothetical protein